MNTEQIRAEFEEWASHYTSYPQKYDLISAWQAYQAGRAAGMRDGRAAAYDSASRMEQMREDGL